jgi:hypothetical protein
MTDHLTTCRHCGSADTMEIPDTTGRHHAKLVCARCETYIRWLPKPTPVVGLENLLLPEPLPRGAALPPLVGTDKQIRFAEKVRREMLRAAWNAGHRDLARSMATIVEAGWWLSNRDTADVGKLKFPSTWRPPPLPLIDPDLIARPPAGLEWLDLGDGTGAWAIEPWATSGATRSPAPESTPPPSRPARSGSTAAPLLEDNTP